MLTGTILNCSGIVIGGILGLVLNRQFSSNVQLAFRGLMGVFTVLVGLRLSWVSLNGSLYQFFKQSVIMLLALMIGRLIGRALHIQKGMNRLGRYAGEKFAEVRPEDPNRFNEGFLVCTMLFCAGPLGPLGAVSDGLMGYWEPLAIKMVMDGLAAMGFVSLFGWGAILSAIPVFAYQSSLTLLAERTEPWLRSHQLVDSVNAPAGMLIFCVALIILELKKVELGDYLPSLLVGPVITWFWR